MATKTTRTVAIPKGTRDFLPADMAVRQRVMKLIEDVFKKYGGVTVDTPVFELKETLLGQYGEDEKLIYELADQGAGTNSALMLRFDNTVPMCRLISMYNIKQIKRYVMAKVYRRDNPNQSKGRYREFMQCDFDIVSAHTTLLPDAECLTMLSEILRALQIGSFTIKISHRQLLDGILTFCGVSADKTRTICSAVDKLDKTPWNEVKAEMLQKGISEVSADNIGKLVCLEGKPFELLEQLEKRPEWTPDQNGPGCEQIRKGLAALREIFGYIKIMGALDHLTFSCQLSRGLDYYDGVVFEAVSTDPAVGISSSLAGGGRFDKLIGNFMGDSSPLRAVGFAVGIERVFAIYAERQKETASIPQAQVHVVFKEETCIPTALKIISQLRGLNIASDFADSPYKKGKQLGKQLTVCDERAIPVVIILGHENESSVSVKNMVAKTQVSSKNIEEAIEYVKSLIKNN